MNDLDLADAVNVWGRYRRREISLVQLQAELQVIEARPTGDEIDRGWEEYRDA